MEMTTMTLTSRALRSALAATALAIGALALSSPAALADTKIPEKTIKSECKAAGGTYSTSVNSSGNRQSSCVYKSISGTTYTDSFSNGHYDGLD
jgi:hypothetical protein